MYILNVLSTIKKIIITELKKFTFKTTDELDLLKKTVII